MRSHGSDSVFSFMEPHHRPLVWAGGAAFFGFPLLATLIPTPQLLSVVWLVPAVLLVSLGYAALSLGDFGVPGGRVLLLILLPLSVGWFLAGSVALRLDHETALKRPSIAAGGAGRLEGVALSDGVRGRGAFGSVSFGLSSFTDDGGERLPASGEVELRIRGGAGAGGEAPLAGSGLTISLSAEEVDLLRSEKRLGTVDGSRLIVAPPEGKAAFFRGRIKEELRSVWRRLGPEASGLARALLLGEREALDPGLLELFRRAGAMHLLALSGMHLGVLAGLLGLLLFPLLGRSAIPVAALFLGLYFWLVGPIPSLLRALLMFLMGAGLRVRGIPADPRSLLAAALLVALLVAAESAVSLGWRLSTYALLGILWVGVPLSLRGPKLPGRPIWTLIWVSLGAMFATAGTSFTVFGEIYPASPVSSLLLTPLVLLFIWNALMLLPLFLLVPSLVPALGTVGKGLYELLSFGGRSLAAIPPLSSTHAPVFGTIVPVALLLFFGTPWLRTLRGGRGER